MTWTAIQDWPGTARGPAWAIGVPSAGGKVYTGGGDDGLGTAVTACHVYDPATNTWSAIASMGVARTRQPAVAYFSGSIYVFGGQDVGVDTATVEVYDIAANTWTAKTAMPAARSRISAARYGGTVYIFMGNAGGTQVFAYSIGSDSWRTITPAASSARTDGASVILGDMGYVSGDTRLMQWNPVTEQWGSMFSDLGLAPLDQVTELAALGTELFMWAGNAGSDVYHVAPAGKTLPVTPAGWTAAGEAAPVASGQGNMAAANGDTLFLLPNRSSLSKLAYKLSVSVITEGATTVQSVVGEFRYHPRWPELIERAARE